VTLDMGKPVTVHKVQITPEGSKIEFFDNNNKLIIPESVTVETEYERKKGPKILNRAESGHERLAADPNRALQKYDLIYAIDTNTKLLNSETLSVAGIILCKITPHAGFLYVQYALVHCFEFRNIQTKPENVAWRTLIEMLMAHPQYSSLKDIGIIVDSDLGNISDYNAKGKPIIDNFYLPDKVTLLYASADRGKEYLANKLITECDKKTNTLIQEIQKNPANTSNLLEVQDLPYTHFRCWNY